MKYDLSVHLCYYEVAICAHCAGVVLFKDGSADTERKFESQNTL